MNSVCDIQVARCGFGSKCSLDVKKKRNLTSWRDSIESMQCTDNQIPKKRLNAYNLGRTSLERRDLCELTSEDGETRARKSRKVYGEGRREKKCEEEKE